MKITLLRRTSRVAIRVFLTAVAVLTLGLRVAPAQDTHEEIWPELDTYVRLASKTRLFFSFRPIISADDRSFSESQLGANIEFEFAPMRNIDLTDSPDRDKYHHLRARLGYWEARSHDVSGAGVTERRIVTELTPRASLPFETLLSVRNRFELRWLDGDDAWRFRLYPKLQRDTPIGSVTFTPYAAVEFFYDSRFDEWNRTRYQVGVSVPTAKWIVPEVYYARQEDRNPVKKYVNILGLKITLHF